MSNKYGSPKKSRSLEQSLRMLKNVDPNDIDPEDFDDDMFYDDETYYGSYSTSSKFYDDDDDWA